LVTETENRYPASKKIYLNPEFISFQHKKLSMNSNSLKTTKCFG
jgi:hypothetical protein